MGYIVIPHKTGQAYLPRLDGLEFLHVFDCLGNIPYLVGINHEHRASWPCILSLERGTVRVTALGAGWEVLQVVNDGADDQSATEVRIDICSNFHLDMVKSSSNSLLCETCNLLI